MTDLSLTQQLKDSKPFFTEISFDPLVEYMAWGGEKNRRSNAFNLQYKSDIILEAEIKKITRFEFESNYDPSIHANHFNKEQNLLLDIIKSLQWGDKRSIQMVNYSRKESSENYNLVKLKKAICFILLRL